MKNLISQITLLTRVLLAGCSSSNRSKSDQPDEKLTLPVVQPTRQPVHC